MLKFANVIEMLYRDTSLCAIQSFDTSFDGSVRIMYVDNLGDLLYKDLSPVFVDIFVMKSYYKIRKRSDYID